MNKNTKLVAGIAAFLVLIVGSSMLYKNLTQKYEKQDILVTEETNNDNTTDSSAETQVTDIKVAETDTTLAETDITVAEADTVAQNAQSDNNKAPDFTVLNTDDEDVTLNSMIGKPIVLNFWASWCPPCKGELPDFQSAYEKNGEDVQFVMVNLTDGVRETKTKALEYMSSQGYTLPIYFDSDQSAASTYNIYSIPTTLFIDAQGNIVASEQGMISQDTLDKGIAMIKGK